MQGGQGVFFFTTMLEYFLNNERIQIFDGQCNNRRPVSSPSICMSGLFTILGKIIVHNLLLDDI